MEHQWQNPAIQFKLFTSDQLHSAYYPQVCPTCDAVRFVRKVNGEWVSSPDVNNWTNQLKAISPFCEDQHVLNIMES